MPCKSCGGTPQRPRSITEAPTVAQLGSPAPRRPARKPYTNLNGTPRRTAPKE